MTQTEHWLLALAGVFCVMVRCNYFTFVRFSAFVCGSIEDADLEEDRKKLCKIQYIFYEISSL
jgi:hypothetical protein